MTQPRPYIPEVDLVLLDTTGTTEISNIKQGLNFTVGNLARALKKARRGNLPPKRRRRSLLKAIREQAIAWVTREGTLRFSNLFREVMNPKANVAELATKHGIDKPAEPTPIQDTLTWNSTGEVQHLVTGNVLNIEATGGGVVGDPATEMVNSNQFHKSKSRKAISLIGNFHTLHSKQTQPMVTVLQQPWSEKRMDLKNLANPNCKDLELATNA